MKIHDLPDGRHAFRCPGCGDVHALNNTWAFNNDYDKPTFSPSVLVTCGHYVNGYTKEHCWCTYNAEHPDDPGPICYRCHSFVKDGKIQFLPDCTHELAGQTVEIPEWDE